MGQIVQTYCMKQKELESEPDNYDYYWSLLYSAIVRSRADSLRSHVTRIIDSP